MDFKISGNCKYDIVDCIIIITSYVCVEFIFVIQKYFVSSVLFVIFALLLVSKWYACMMCKKNSCPKVYLTSVNINLIKPIQHRGNVLIIFYFSIRADTVRRNILARINTYLLNFLFIF